MANLVKSVFTPSKPARTQSDKTEHSVERDVPSPVKASQEKPLQTKFTTPSKSDTTSMEQTPKQPVDGEERLTFDEWVQRCAVLNDAVLKSPQLPRFNTDWRAAVGAPRTPFVPSVRSVSHKNLLLTLSGAVPPAYATPRTPNAYHGTPRPTPYSTYRDTPRPPMTARRSPYAPDFDRDREALFDEEFFAAPKVKFGPHSAGPKLQREPQLTGSHTAPTPRLV